MSLHTNVTEQLRTSLKEFFPLWLELQNQPLDQRRVLTPERVGAYTISIEGYHGLNSNIRSMALISDNESIRILKSIIDKYQPSLAGYLAIPGQSMYIGDISRHVVCWCQYINEQIKLSKTIDIAISDLISDLDDLISKSQMSREIFAPVDGLTLTEDFDQVQIDSTLILRKLTMEELKELVSEDVMFSTGRSDLFRSTATVIISTQPAQFSLKDFEAGSEPLAFNQNIYEPILNLMACLHILKPGRISIIEYQHHFIPKVLPFPQFSVGSFKSNSLGFNLELNKQEAVTIKQFYKALHGIEWSALKIAIGRLADAETRISSTDSLLDSVIGLEVLLNPVERSELAFRVALHYSYLGEKAERRNRYDLMRKIQETRNIIVHGGANVGSSRANEIANYSMKAKDCLREVILKFLIEGLAKSKKKLDADFWLDFILKS